MSPLVNKKISFLVTVTVTIHSAGTISHWCLQPSSPPVDYRFFYKRYCSLSQSANVAAPAIAEPPRWLLLIWHFRSCSCSLFAVNCCCCLLILTVRQQCFTACRAIRRAADATTMLQSPPVGCSWSTFFFLSPVGCLLHLTASATVLPCKLQVPATIELRWCICFHTAISLLPLSSASSQIIATTCITWSSWDM